MWTDELTKEQAEVLQWALGKGIDYLAELRPYYKPWSENAFNGFCILDALNYDLNHTILWDEYKAAAPPEPTEPPVIQEYEMGA